MSTPDILQPIPQDQIANSWRARWHQVVISNGEAMSAKGLIAQGEWAPVRDPGDGSEAVRVAGPTVRDAALDLRLAFDPTDADHLLAMTVLDRLIKAAYLARVAATTPAPETTQP